ncbi:hypothetical protein AB0C42_20430 [Micromonospora taraxaci]|uniref:hypothetical protein n=1 Tax=Micromonospora taraxaci TaxID=1316803 RepID=UPI0034071B68
MRNGDKASDARRDSGGFLRWVELTDDDTGRSAYPFTLPVVAGLRAGGRLTLAADRGSRLADLSRNCH